MRRKYLRTFLIAALVAFPLIALADPSGTTTGAASDLALKDPKAPTLSELADAIGHNKVAINMVWTLIAGFLVMFMQAGFALVETGFTRAKNAAHTMAMNIGVYGIGMLAFWACGFALQMGGVGALSTLGGNASLNHEATIHLGGHAFGLFGMKGFFLTGVAMDVGIFAMFLFQAVFMDTAATIPTGALAERWKFKSFAVFSIFIGALIYPIYANWVWGNGWLANLGNNFQLGHGTVDFAGSSVVHMTGGVIAFVTCRAIGARVGKYGKDGRVNAIPGHHLPMAVLGTIILAFGWFGFNAGSTLAGTDLRISVVAVNSLLASASGMCAAMVYYWLRYGKPDPSMMCNGMLAGLVAITAPCAFVSAPGAVAIGAIAGVVVVMSCVFVEHRLKIDDPVGAISVHGVCGALGVLSVGLFADGNYGDGYNGIAGGVKGLFYGGGAKQLLAQGMGVGANIIWVATAALAAWWITGKLVRGNRVTTESEVEGLDTGEMGAHAYPDFHIAAPGGSHGIKAGETARDAVEEPVAVGRPLTAGE